MKVFYLTILIGFLSQFTMAAISTHPVDSETVSPTTTTAPTFTHPADSQTLEELEGQWKFIGFSCKLNRNNLNTDHSSIDDTFVFSSDGSMSILIKEEDCEINHTGIYTASFVNTGAIISQHSGRPAPTRVIEGKLLIIKYEEEIAYKGSCSTTPTINSRNQITIMLHDDGHFYLSDSDLSKDICEKGSGYSVFKKQ